MGTNSDVKAEIEVNSTLAAEMAIALGKDASGKIIDALSKGDQIEVDWAQIVAMAICVNTLLEDDDEHSQEN